MKDDEEPDFSKRIARRKRVAVLAGVLSYLSFLCILCGTVTGHVTVFDFPVAVVLFLLAVPTAAVVGYAAGRIHRHHWPESPDAE